MKRISLLWLVMAVAQCAAQPSGLWLGMPPEGVLRARTPLEVAEAELQTAGRNCTLLTDSAMPEDAFVVSGDTVKGASEKALMYGVYALLGGHGGSTAPRCGLRMLNHWDNLDGTVERGYAGRSIWRWDELPEAVSPRYRHYGRLNASVGINAVVLNNVNASARILETPYLIKVARIADELRPFGISVWLSANFAAPMQLGCLPDADPLNPDVEAWWRGKADEIYALIPDFGGFLVKANSEGQPGPCDFGRTHADGANMLARALQPHGGRVVWRAFVYSASDADRAMQAYAEFQPLDGQFEGNVILQVKNGPIDFQPREPYSPLFDGMADTRLGAELQVTQEYLGHSNHLVYLAPMWSEFFGHVPAERLSAVAGVANVGDAPNFTAHPFGGANWYAFGRLSWDSGLDPRAVAGEWLAQTEITTDGRADAPVADIMMRSHEAVVDYMMPMGLHHLFAFGHHYGPEPWCDRAGARADWLPRYYHRADSAGLGFDRTVATGSGATAQYARAFGDVVEDAGTCPEKYLLWFHHVSWSSETAGGTLWERLCRHYANGAEEARRMAEEWRSLREWLEPGTFADVDARLATQSRDACWWRDACLLYFQRFSGMEIPADIPVEHTLEQLMEVSLPISNHEAPTAGMLDAVR